MALAPDSRKIVVCIDGSEQADCAFDWYLKNVMQPNDYVYGVHVPEYHLSGVSVGPLADTEALTSEFNKQHTVVTKLCSDYTAKLRSVNCKGQVDAHSGGKPGEVICEQAEKLGASSIIMGTRGQSKLKKMIMGSVSNHVVQHAPCPVSVVPSKKK